MSIHDHPEYPPECGDPAMDRCICGGVKHWHADPPLGCDDCVCEKFSRQMHVLPSRTAGHVYVVLDGPVGPECGRFVECENAYGTSISLGEWVTDQRHGCEGWWMLEIADPRISTLAALDVLHPQEES